MSELRIGTFLALSAAVIALGCDNGNGGTDAGPDMDGGGTLVDSGPPVDSGPQPDTGTTMDDGGGTADTCGNPGECDVLAQDCGAGMACRNLVMSAGETPMGICEVAGTKSEGEACSRATMPECAEGLICYEGACRAYCCDGRTADCPTLGSYCQPFSDTTVGLCLVSCGCDLLTQMGGDQQAGEGCYPLPGGITRCSEPAPGAGGDGTDCSTLDGCSPGFACIGSVCRAFCDLAADPSDCPTDYSCNNLTDHDGVGVCVPSET